MKKIIIICLIVLIIFSVIPIEAVDWFRAPDAPWPGRSDHTTLVFRDTIWLLGGASAWSSPLFLFSDIWKSPNGYDWYLVTDSAPWSGRAGHTCIVFRDTIWMFGGITDTIGAYARDIWKSPNGYDWYLVTDSAPWPGRCGHTTLVFRDTIWLLGGMTSHGSRPDIWKSPNGYDWFLATDWPGWMSRCGHTTLVFRDTIWLLGGFQFNPPRSDIWKSPNGYDWYLVTDSAPWPGRSDHTTLVFRDTIWLLGGAAPDSSGRWRGLNDVWYSTGLNGGAIEETKPFTQLTSPSPTIIRSIFHLRINQPSTLLDISGRRVATLRPGANDIRLRSGIYFLLDADQRRKIVIIK